MKKLIFPFIIILILASVGFGVYKYLSNPRVIASDSEQIITCVDTDGNNIYEKGRTEYSYKNIGEEEEGEEETRAGQEETCDYFDERTSSKVGLLRESYCLNDQVVTDLVNCGLGSICRSGQCVEGKKTLPICSDSDNGIEPKTFGEVNDGVPVVDSCWISPNKLNPEQGGGFTSSCSGSNCYTYEYFCDGERRNHQIISSPQGCSVGVET